MSETILSIRSLSKTYSTFKKEPGLWGGVKALVRRQKVLVPAVRDLDFTIARGEFVGLLGPNGAGKTTTLKMLTGLIAPTAGSSTAFGKYDTAKRPAEYLRRIGMVMGQRNQLNPDLPPMDSFRLAQALYGIDDARFDRRLKQCLDLFEIHDKVLTPVRKLSLGERMKMELILAILHEPELLFLDEPTIGLDFNAARQIRDFLAEANAQLGITVVLTSHYTKDIEELCRRVVLINHGRMVFDGPLTGMDERLQGQKVVAIALDAEDVAHTAHGMLTEMGRDSAVGKDDDGRPQVSFDVPARYAAMTLERLLSRLKAERVVDVKVAERPLDEIFAEIYRQSPESGAAGSGA